MKFLGTDANNGFRKVFAWLIILAEFFPLFASGPSKSSSTWISVDPRSFSALAFLPPFPLAEPEVVTRAGATSIHGGRAAQLDQPAMEKLSLQIKLSFFRSLMANTGKWWGRLPKVWLLAYISCRRERRVCVVGFSPKFGKFGRLVFWAFWMVLVWICVVLFLFSWGAEAF